MVWREDFADKLGKQLFLCAEGDVAKIGFAVREGAQSAPLGDLGL